MQKLLFILLLATVMISCKKEATVWESDWSAPIIDDTLSLVNLVNDSTLSESPLGFYELDLFRTVFKLDVNDVVKIPDTTIAKSYTISFMNLNVSPGTSFVNSVEEYEMMIPDGVELKKVILKEGYIDIRVENPIATNAIFKVALPGVSLDGVSFDNQYKAPPGTNSKPGIVEKTIDISGYHLDLTGLSGSEFNKMKSQITVLTDPTGPSVDMTNQDVTKIFATFRGVQIDYARGYFGNKTMSDTVEFTMGGLEIYESGIVDLPNTSIIFEIENGIKVGAQGTLHTVSNENATGNLVELSNSQIGTSFNVNPALGTWNTLTPSLKTIEFNSANSNIESYLENLGTKHKVGYSIQLNPWGNASGGWDELYPNSTMNVNLRAKMPLAIGIDDLILKDTFDVALNQDPAKTHILSGELILNASNGFPFSADVALLFLNSSGTVLHTVKTTSEIRASQEGDFDSDYNFNIANSEIRMVLPADLIDDINDIKQVVIRSKFNSTNPTTDASEQMLVPVGAFLGVKIRTNFKSENRY